MPKEGNSFSVANSYPNLFAILFYVPGLYKFQSSQRITQGRMLKIQVPMSPLRSAKRESGMIWLTHFTLLRKAALGELQMSNLCFSKSFPSIRRISITWEFVRNVQSQTSSQGTESESESLTIVFVVCPLKFEKHPIEHTWRNVQCKKSITCLVQTQLQVLIPPHLSFNIYLFTKDLGLAVLLCFLLNTEYVNDSCLTKFVMQYIMFNLPL